MDTHKTCDNTIMIRVDEKIITGASQVSQHMNEFFVNIASSIGENINVSQKNRNECRFRLEVRTPL